MAELMADAVVWWSVATAGLVLAVAALIFELDGRWLLPPVAVYGTGTAAGLATGRIDGDAYRRWYEGVAPWSVLVALAAVAALTTAAGHGRRQRRPPTELGLLLGAAGVGIFLCVPETGLLRILVGPLALAGIGSWLGRLRPWATADALAVAAALAWVTVVDGQVRGSSIVGGAACLGAVAFLPLAGRPVRPIGGTPTRPWSADHRWALIGLELVMILLCSRVAGLASSPGLAAAQAALTLGLGAAALRWWAIRAGGSP